MKILIICPIKVKKQKKTPGNNFTMRQHKRLWVSNCNHATNVSYNVPHLLHSANHLWEIAPRLHHARYIKLYGLPSQTNSSYKHNTHRLQTNPLIHCHIGLQMRLKSMGLKVILSCGKLRKQNPTESTPRLVKTLKKYPILTASVGHSFYATWLGNLDCPIIMQKQIKLSNIIPNGYPYFTQHGWAIRLT